MSDALSLAFARGPSVFRALTADTYAHLLATAPSQPPKGALSPAEAQERNRLYDVVDGIAVIGVEGLLLPDTGWIGYSGATGYGDLEFQIGAALADPSIKAIALYVDSGGGRVDGLFEFTDWLAENRGDKPIVALCDTAYSAAYAIAAACDRVVAAPMGGVGSIGVLLVHVEISKALEEFGIAVNVIRSPDGKARGNFLEQLDEATRATFQAGVDELAEIFAKHVAGHRDIEVSAVIETNAALFDLPSGTAAALSLELVDAVMPLPAALQELRDFSTAA